MIPGFIRLPRRTLIAPAYLRLLITGLPLDGARIANAVAALGCSLRELTVDTGVDVLTFRGTKNGLLYGEAII